jgi:hypothetical protein
MKPHCAALPLITVSPIHTAVGPRRLS